MNKKIDLTKILKNCPKGTKFYTPTWGEVTFIKINIEHAYPICIITDMYDDYVNLTKDGRYLSIPNTECIIFPSKEQRDWSKFGATWYKKEKFDPKTLNVFDKVLVKISNDDVWTADFFSHYDPLEEYAKYVCVTNLAVFCIPYNDDTKHLVGTTEEAPEYYRYWED